MRRVYLPSKEKQSRFQCRAVVCLFDFPDYFSGETVYKVSNHELGMSITFVGTFNRVFGLSILTAGRGREEGPDSLLRGSYGYGHHLALSMKTV